MWNYFRRRGKTVCFIGDGINDSIALKKANVSISLRGASTIATDTAQVVFMEESLAKLVQLHDISHQLQQNVDRSWQLILVPNAICVAGAFFAGFGVMHSMVFNQIGAIVALANGLLPLRKVAEAQAEKDRAAELLFNSTHPAQNPFEGLRLTSWSNTISNQAIFDDT